VAFDLLIRGGMVVDGTGAPGRVCDVGVADGRIAELAPRLAGSAAETVDARDLVVAPGFIDSHTHLDGQLFWDKEASSSAWHGCTTVVFGNCGFTFAPIPDGDPEYPKGLMAGVEQIPREVIEGNVPFDWRSFGDYVRSLERSGLPVNAASYVGYPVVRHAVMGERALGGAPTAGELRAIEALVRDALDAGALGISFNRQPGDCDDKGRPSAGVDCGFDEIAAVVALLREYPGTLVQAVPGFLMPFQGFSEENLREQESWIGALRGVGRPMVFGPTFEAWGELFYAYIERARAQGVEMWSTGGAIPIGSMATFQVPNVFRTIQGWEGVFEVTGEERIRLFSDASYRERLRAHAGPETFIGYPLQTVDERGQIVRGPEISYSWGNIYRLPAPPAPFRCDGPSVLEEARQRGCHPVDVVLDGAVQSGLREFLIVFPLPYDPEAILRHLEHPHILLSTNDTGAHLLMVCNANSTHLLGHWVRRSKRIGLERAVHLLTGRQAQAFRLVDRGTLAPGKAADLVLFDPERIDAQSYELAHDIPGGHARFLQRSTGIERVIVNGRTLLRGGRPTGEMPGAFLRPRQMARAS
jgi:N-acyl-D-aspartate/D-glutamate deacylase